VKLKTQYYLVDEQIYEEEEANLKKNYLYIFTNVLNNNSLNYI